MCGCGVGRMLLACTPVTPNTHMNYVVVLNSSILQFAKWELHIFLGKNLGEPQTCVYVLLLSWSFFHHLFGGNQPRNLSPSPRAPSQIPPTGLTRGTTPCVWKPSTSPPRSTTRVGWNRSCCSPGESTWRGLDTSSPCRVDRRPVEARASNIDGGAFCRSRAARGCVHICHRRWRAWGTTSVEVF